MSCLGYGRYRDSLVASFLDWDDLDFQFVAGAEGLYFGILEPIPGEEIPGAVLAGGVGFRVRNCRGALGVKVDGAKVGTVFV